ncbi:hypothetical protein EE612_007558, partial [Oryza sativa]
MMSASTEPTSPRCASSTNSTESRATRHFCGGSGGAHHRPAELVEEARHGDRIGDAEGGGGGGLALPLAEALLRDVLVVGRLERGRHGGVGGGDGVRVLGNLGFHVRGGGRGGGEGAEAAAAAAVGRERDAPGGGRTATEAEVCA